MRKTFALTAAVIGMIGALATAPGASASSSVANEDPVPVVAIDPSLPTPDALAYNTPAGTEVDASGSSVYTGDKNFFQYGYATCLDDSPAYGLRLHTCSSESAHNPYQTWSFRNTDGSYRFKNYATGLCLDGSDNYGVRPHACSTASYDNGYQKWRKYASNSAKTYVSWQNVATGTCMDYSSGHGLRLHTCSTAAFSNGYQTWSL
ncbi:RICIN domain-containing protein [Streptomyces sp. NBC_01022]|uniref:RICIN domain-containing protein n=1 Tax=Streptomyces sp. NBC_01022 TaxID=2903723 RepID=UPI002DD9FB1A|nr:ricin-type beta-trefoil lectin domain protein [Streptomyces sp. NBC_01022]WRZ82268.1 RICIN domain-containing protein [Streptomyces sp. NBC_01022]